MNTSDCISSIQISPEKTPSPNYFIPLQMILPEHVAETVVPEPVQVIESEQTVTVTVSEQQPEQSHQTTPKQTSISTPTPTQPETQNSPQKDIPEPVVETVVPESVPATESKQTVAITVSEPIQTHQLNLHQQLSPMTNPYLHHPQFRPYNNHPPTC